MTAAVASSMPLAAPDPSNWLSSIADWLGTGGYAPHGFCLIWDANLIALYWVGNGGIALAYMLIPIGLLYLYRRTKLFTGLSRWVIFEFALFILCCGVSHVFQIINLYHGWYWAEAIWINITSFVSLMTAATLPFAIKHMMHEGIRQTVRRIIRDAPE